jgi:hypothetical protein
MQKIRCLLAAFVIFGSCSNEKDKIIYIGFAVTDAPQYAPCEVKMINYTQNATTFLWDFGDQGTSDEFEPTHLYNEPGKYTITLTAANSSFSKSVSKDLTVLQAIPVVTSPPASLKLDPFYKKYVDAQGIPVISSAKVPDEALIHVLSMANAMLKKSPALRAKMVAYHARIGIMSKDEVTTDIPEHAFLANDPNTDWNKRARGLGGTVAVPISTCAEENVMCYALDSYRNEDIFVHEFGHAIHLMGIRFVDTNFDTSLKTAFDNAKAAGKWAKTYAGSNTEEYWAEGIQSWFNCAAQSDPPNGVYNYVNTRAELKNYDPALYELLRTWLPEDETYISCHRN